MQMLIQFAIEKIKNFSGKKKYFEYDNSKLSNFP